MHSYVIAFLPCAELNAHERNDTSVSMELSYCKKVYNTLLTCSHAVNVAKAND
jgi:hypothetical protein